MELLLDTANLEQIRRYNDYYLISGVTTNPSILAKEGKPFFAHLEEVRKIVGEAKQLHVQVSAECCDEMLREAEAIAARLGKDVYIKVPVVEEGIKAMKLLKEQGYRLTATAVVVPQQAFLAGSVGADYVAPYVNRMENLNIEPFKAIESMRKIYANQHIETKVLGASFKNTQQVIRAYETGAEAVTLAPELLSTMCTNPVTELWVDNFEKDWRALYGEHKIYEL